jgi:Leucine-rich repeat (LRR) protein
MERPDDYELLTELNISKKKLTELPSWVSECKKLEILDCSRNNITHLDNLPPNLKKLYCYVNLITHLDNVPQSLLILECNINNKP